MPQQLPSSLQFTKYFHFWNFEAFLQLLSEDLQIFKKFKDDSLFDE